MARRILLVDIDGLRPDVLKQELSQGHLPHIANLLGGEGLSRGLLTPVLAPAPSITFTSQACLFTGAHPAKHGIPGNQFFDRFGKHSRGKPRHYAFDVGDTLAADDAVRVFIDGLAEKCLLVPTMYAALAEQHFRSVVVANMYAAGASVWLKPSLVNLARFTKGGNVFGLSAEDYDLYNLNQALDEISRNGLPEILTMYFMGLDHESHLHGPQVQAGYLQAVLDPMIGELWERIVKASGAAPANLPFCVIFSDHGQIGVPADDQHSLRLGFPFERELGHLFDALGLDVHDYPGEDPACDAVLACNGGLAHLYLQNRRGRWAQTPVFERDVLPVAQAFWEAHISGRYAQELHGALAGILVRNVEQDSWDAPYLALTPDRQLLSLAEWFDAQPGELYADPVHRLRNLAGPMVGDVLLISNYSDGYYFASPLAGVHGGLHPQDSWSTLAFGWPAASEDEWERLQQAISGRIRQRCQTEDDRSPSTADLRLVVEEALAMHS
jgi:hypothetical protein